MRYKEVIEEAITCYNYSAHLPSSLPSQMPLHVHLTCRRHGEALAVVASRAEIRLDARDGADVADEVAGEAPQKRPWER